MVQLSLFSTAICLLWTTIVHAQDDRAPNTFNYFISPPRSGYSIGADVNAWNTNQVYTQGKPLSLSWATNYSSVAVTLHAEGNPASMTLSPSNSVKSFTWDGSLTSAFDITSQPVFFFMLVEAVEFSNGGISTRFFSHYFNITKAVASSSSSSASSSSRSSSSGSVTSLSTGTAAGASSTASSTSVPKSSNAGAIGGGVGGGIAGLILIIAAIFFFLKYRKTKKQNAMLSNAVMQQNAQGYAYNGGAAEKAYAYEHQSPSELPATPAAGNVWEMPAESKPPGPR